MTPETFLAQFGLIADSPNGVQKLRELILNLAVRGKLVPQDPNDESASELLKRIAAEKDRLMKEGVIKKFRPLPEVNEDSMPFVLPTRWTWARLGNIAIPQAGFAFKSNGFNKAKRGLPLIRIRDVGQPHSGTFFDGDFRPEFLVQRGDYLISMDGEFRVAQWDHSEALLNQRVTRLIFLGTEIAKRFVADSLLLRLVELQGVKAYTTVDHLSGTQIAESLIGLPPVEEQKRIVARVDQLMALCDRLEVQQKHRGDILGKAAAAALDTLVNSADSHAFDANWRRIAAHFDDLIDSTESLKTLRGSILDLAVRGKLVSQNPNDEPASELLKRIAAENDRLVKEGKAKKAKPSCEINSDDAPFVVPKEWEWVAFDTLIDAEKPISYGVLVPGPDIPHGVPFVRLADLSLNEPAAAPEKSISKEVDDQYSRTRLHGGEILMGVVGSIGKLGIAPLSWKGANIARAICRIEPVRVVHKGFVVLLLQSVTMQVKFKADTRTLAQPTLNVGLIRQAPTPLPPLEEQKRIVAKVDRLMAVCDRLEVQLAAREAVGDKVVASFSHHFMTA